MRARSVSMSRVRERARRSRSGAETRGLKRLVGRGRFTAVFHQWGYMQVTAPWQLLRGVVLVSFIATLVEALPANRFVDDNISVPIAAFLAGLAFL